MNARKMKKHLKKQIDKLQSDNDLMHKIIADSPSMQELYDRWKQPLNVIHTRLQYEKFKVKRTLDFGACTREAIEHTKQLAARELLETIKDSITYEVDTEQLFPTVTASIIVGYSWQKEDKDVKLDWY